MGSRVWGILVLALALGLLAPAASLAAPPGPDEIISREIQNLDTSRLEAFIASLDSETQSILPEFDPAKLVRGHGIDWKGIVRALISRLFREIVINARLIAQMVVLAVVCVVLRNIQMNDGSASELGFAVCFLAMFVISVQGFSIAQQTARDAVTQMGGFVYAVLPIMVTLLAAVGGLGTAAMMHPLMVAAVGLTCQLIAYVVLPLALFSAVVGAVGQLSDKYPLSKLAGFLRTLTTGVLGFGLCVFMGFVTVRGLVAAVGDGLTLRTAKFVSGSFVPVVGKFFSDAMELITGCSLLIKNGIGVYAMAGLLVVCALPAIKILVLSLLFKLIGALLQPLGEPRLADALTSMGMSLNLVFAAVAVAGLMFLIGIAVLVGLSNLTVMVR